MEEWIRKKDAIEAALWALDQFGGCEKWRVELVREMIENVPGVSVNEKLLLTPRNRKVLYSR